MFHSQFNPRTPITATPWSLLLLPAYFQNAGSIQRALVLGVGGGAVIRLLQHCIQPAAIVGVEVDPVHIYVARRFFGVTPRVADLVQADAVSWLRAYQGPKFDLIIDDLYGESAGEPYRVVQPDKSWLSALTDNLTRDGVLAVNFIAMQELRDAVSVLQARNRKRLDMALQLTLPAYENVVGVFMNQRLAKKPLRQLLRGSETPCAEALAKLPYRVRRVSN